MRRGKVDGWWLLPLWAAACGGDPDPGPEAPKPVDPWLPYGHQTITVSATQYWVNTGLYVRAGDPVALAADGAWTMSTGDWPVHGPEGTAYEIDECAWGSLVASIGLAWNTPKICVGAGVDFSADRAGIVFVGPNDYVLEDNDGAMTVDIQSPGARTLTIDAVTLATYDLAPVPADMVEVAGVHFLLSLPRDYLADNRADGVLALGALDAFYDSHATLAGAVPYGGQRVRYFPDPTVADLGAWMIAGNPIRYDPQAMDGSPEVGNILKVHDPSYHVWGFVHELGHDFTFVNRGRYLIGEGPTEAWANVFTLFTLAALDYPEKDRAFCDGVETFKATGTYEQLVGDPWLPLCMLMEFRASYGWSFFSDFFANYNQLDLSGVPDTDAPDWERWAWLRDRFDMISGQSTTSVFEAYHVPLAP